MQYEARVVPKTLYLYDSRVMAVRADATPIPIQYGRVLAESQDATVSGVGTREGELSRLEWLYGEIGEFRDQSGSAENNSKQSKALQGARRRHYASHRQWQRKALPVPRSVRRSHTPLHTHTDHRHTHTYNTGCTYSTRSSSTKI